MPGFVGLAGFGLTSGLVGLTSGLVGLTSGLVGLMSGLVGLMSGLVGLTSGLVGLTSGLVGLTSGLMGLMSGLGSAGSPRSISRSCEVAAAVITGRYTPSAKYAATLIYSSPLTAPVKFPLSSMNICLSRSADVT